MVRTAASRSAAVHVFHLGLGDFFKLGTGDLANLVQVWTGRALVQLDGLLDQHRRWRRLDNEGEALVCERCDDHRQWQSGLNTLSLRIECLAELHDVQATLTQRGADRWEGLALPAGTCSLMKPTIFFAMFSPYG